MKHALWRSTGSALELAAGPYRPHPVTVPALAVVSRGWLARLLDGLCAALFANRKGY